VDVVPGAQLRAEGVFIEIPMLAQLPLIVGVVEYLIAPPLSVCAQKEDEGQEIAL
jgi:hypothetical protein